MQRGNALFVELVEGCGLSRHFSGVTLCLYSRVREFNVLHVMCVSYFSKCWVWAALCIDTGHLKKYWLRYNKKITIPQDSSAYEKKQI